MFLNSGHFPTFFSVFSGLNPTEAEVRKCLRGEPDERLSFEAFLPIFSTINKNRDTSTPEDFIEGFKVWE